MTSTKYDYCHDHGGWGSADKPCKVCGQLGPSNDMPEIPKGFSLHEAFKWGAEQINNEIKKKTI
tara:strand:+ start:16110 stop:16301 length:192 start_codon:yes stop_codon:yes gene_type:complete